MELELKCPVCDGPYCGQVCKGRDGYVWVVGHGWKSPNVVRASINLAKAIGEPVPTVYWDDVWTPERFDPQAIPATDH